MEGKIRSEITTKQSSLERKLQLRLGFFNNIFITATVMRTMKQITFCQISHDTTKS